MGAITGLWAAVVSAIADTIQEVSGNLMGRLKVNAGGFGAGSTPGYAPGDNQIGVAEISRWPQSGRFVLNGVTGYYASRSAVTLNGITDEDGDTGIQVTANERDVITLLATHTDVGRVKDSFFLDTAEGPDLDTIGRNNGLQRIRGLDDAGYRALLRVAIAIEGGSIYAMEKVLDAVGITYTLYEDLETFDHTVFVDIPATPATESRGKSYLVGQEAQAQVTATTVDVNSEPLVVAGIWDSADYDRDGLNYAELLIAVTEVNGTDQLLGTWLTTDLNKSVVRASNGAIWQVRTVLSPTLVQVGTKTRTNGSTSAGAPTVFRASEAIFRTWMAGHSVVILGGNNAGVYPIVAVDENLAEVTCSGAAFLTETSVSWFIRPNFVGTIAAHWVHRATITGTTITTPVAMPANVLVDYATVPSAQVIEKASTNADDQYAFYLFDETFLARAVLDIVRAAGFRVVVNAV